MPDRYAADLRKGEALQEGLDRTSVGTVRREQLEQAGTGRAVPRRHLSLAGPALLFADFAAQGVVLVGLTALLLLRSVHRLPLARFALFFSVVFHGSIIISI